MNQTILPEILDSGENKSIAISVPDKYKINYLELKNHVNTASNLFLPKFCIVSPYFLWVLNTIFCMVFPNLKEVIESAIVTLAKKYLRKFW